MIAGSVAYLTQYEWLDKWQIKYGNSDVIVTNGNGVRVYANEHLAALAIQPYEQQLRLMLKLFSGRVVYFYYVLLKLLTLICTLHLDNASLYSCILEELTFTLKNGGLGQLSMADTDEILSTQRLTIFVYNTNNALFIF